MIRLFAVTLSITLLPAPTLTRAASQDECAIWLCLPGGFPSGCGKAKSAMKKRLRKLKPPLPAFKSCASGGENFTSSYNIAAYIPPHLQCIRQGIGSSGIECVEWQQVPESWVSGAFCVPGGDDDESTAGCTRTDIEIHIYESGKPFEGSPYYFSLYKK